MFTFLFWKDAFERAVSTAAQAALLALGAEALNVLQADWVTVAGFALGGAVLSLLKSLIASRVGDGDSASLVKRGKYAE